MVSRLWVTVATCAPAHRADHTNAAPRINSSTTTRAARLRGSTPASQSVIAAIGGVIG